MASILNMLAGLQNVGAPPTSTYDPQLTPEANKMAGAVPPPAPGFQRPKGLTNTVGKIADFLAVLGGGTPAYSSALEKREAQFNNERKQSVMGRYLANPRDEAAAAEFAQVAPAEYFQVMKELTPKPQNPGSVSDFQYALKMKSELPADDPRLPMIDAYLAKQANGAPIMRGTPGGGTAVIDPSNYSATTIIPGREPAPAAASGPAPSAFERRAEQIRATLGEQAYAEFLATGKVTTATSNPAKGGALGSTIGDIRALYQELNRVGGMVDPKAGVVSNIRARAANSDIGQMVSGALGTEAQTIRDQLASALPALMQQVKQATGMTAAQVNSIPEMRLLQDQVTNPTRSYPAVSATLDAIERRYLGGKPAAKAPAAAGGFKVVGKRKQ